LLLQELRRCVKQRNPRNLWATSVQALTGRLASRRGGTQELPGEFTSFNFVKGIPAPFNFGLAILTNDKMLTLQEKIQCIPALAPMLVEGQVCQPLPLAPIKVPGMMLRQWWSAVRAVTVQPARELGLHIITGISGKPYELWLS
jgi:hypothetical protein